MITKFEDLPCVTVELGPAVSELGGHFYVMLEIDDTWEGTELLGRLMLTAAVMMHAYGTVWIDTQCGPANEPAKVGLRVESCSVEGFLWVLSEMPTPSIYSRLHDDREWAIRKFHPMSWDPPEDRRGTSPPEENSDQKEGAR